MITKANFRNVGEYRFFDKCRFCGHSTVKVVDLGYMPLAGCFLGSEKDFSKEKEFPLTLAFCENCYLLQTREVISKDVLFKNYFYHSSAIQTLVNHFKEIANELAKQSFPTKNKLVVEIGCNDGSFVNACLKKGFRALGVDPAINVVKPLMKRGAPIINDYFTPKIAKRIESNFGKADIIFSSNTLAHIENLHEVFVGIKYLLKDDGMLIFENHYLGNLIKQTQYDMIYHEHQYYYSLTTLVNFLRQFDIEVFDVRFIPIHAGSIQIHAQKITGKRKKRDNVSKILQKERLEGLTDKRTFISFEKQIRKTKSDLLLLLDKLKMKKKEIAGYGASGRGTMLMNYCGLGDNFLNYVIDDAPEKQGAYTPGNHLEIVSSAILNSKNKPDYVVLFAWSFWEEVKKRNAAYFKTGGKFVIPLPTVKII